MFVDFEKLTVTPSFYATCRLSVSPYKIAFVPFRLILPSRVEFDFANNSVNLVHNLRRELIDNIDCLHVLDDLLWS